MVPAVGLKEELPPTDEMLVCCLEPAVVSVIPVIFTVALALFVVFCAPTVMMTDETVEDDV